MRAIFCREKALKSLKLNFPPFLDFTIHSPRYMIRYRQWRISLAFLCHGSALRSTWWLSPLFPRSTIHKIPVTCPTTICTVIDLTYMNTYLWMLFQREFLTPALKKNRYQMYISIYFPYHFQLNCCHTAEIQPEIGARKLVLFHPYT